MADHGRCPDHTDHENRIKRLEADMGKTIEYVNKFSPTVLLAFLGFAGTCVATVGSLIGVVLAAAMKAHGWM